MVTEEVEKKLSWVAAWSYAMVHSRLQLGGGQGKGGCVPDISYIAGLVSPWYAERAGMFREGIEEHTPSSQHPPSLHRASNLSMKHGGLSHVQHWSFLEENLPYRGMEEKPSADTRFIIKVHTKPNVH